MSSHTHDTMSRVTQNFIINKESQSNPLLTKLHILPSNIAPVNKPVKAEAIAKSYPLFIGKHKIYIY